MTEMYIPVLGMEVPVAAYVEKGVELFLPPLRAVRGLVDVGTLGAVVDRECVAGEVTPINCKAICLVSFIEVGVLVVVLPQCTGNGCDKVPDCPGAFVLI